MVNSYAAGALNWGWSTATPVSGDFNGDGKYDLAVYDSATALDATGKTLSFTLPAAMANGETMLHAAGTGGVSLSTGATASLNGMAGALTSLIPGNALVLIDKTSGTINATTQSYVDGATTRTVYTNSNNGKLSAFVTKLQTDTLNVTSDYAVTAGNYTGENVALEVTAESNGHGHIAQVLDALKSAGYSYRRIY